MLYISTTPHSNTWSNFLVTPISTAWLLRWYFKAIWWRAPSFVVVVVVVLVNRCRWLVRKVSRRWVLPLVGIQERLQVFVEVGSVEEHRVCDAWGSAGGGQRQRWVRHVRVGETRTRKHICQAVRWSPSQKLFLVHHALHCLPFSPHFYTALFLSMALSNFIWNRALEVTTKLAGNKENKGKQWMAI